MIEILSTKGFLVMPHISEDRETKQAYRTRWSLQPLLDMAEMLNSAERSFLETLEEQFRAIPLDADPSKPPLEEEEIAKLTRFFFPPFRRKNQFGALAKPLFYDQILLTDDGFDLMTSGQVEQDDHIPGNSATVRAGMLILSKIYGEQLPHLESNEINYRNEESGLLTHFMMMPNMEHIEIEVHGEKPKLNRTQIRELLADPDNIELWLERLPVETFSFKGVEITQAIDLTPEIAQGELQRLLLKREAVLRHDRTEQLGKVLRNLLRVPDLAFGIHAIDYPLSYAVAHQHLVRLDILNGKINDLLDPELGLTIYSSTCESGNVKIFDDLEDCLAEADPISDSFLAKGFRSLVLVPLYGKGEHIVGMMQLASKRSYAFNNLIIRQLESVIPLFRQAIRKTRTDMESRIQSVMRQTFTDLDPRVEWRFVKAAADIIEQSSDGTDTIPTIDPIRFEDVWALFGQADIVGSSKLRNDAIRKDMILELNAAIQLLEAQEIALLFPLAGKLAFDGRKLLARLSEEMSPNDEQEVQQFLAVSFLPTLKQLGETKVAKKVVKTYKKELAIAHGNGLTNRQAYEESVSKLSSVISQSITSSEEEAQRIIPHYFSKYRTDGIEFNIYAGQSLLPTGKFTKIHLQNLRLWQLQALVNVTKSVAGLQESLPLKMTTAQLIFAFGQPITIQFRMDEKRFDVEGAYNVRYEVIKKRIDKALVLGTKQRLTLPDHLAVVYTHVTDRKMYIELLQYLSESGQVVGEVEELELEPMQGVDGLSALRVRVV
ncbi:MAG: GAF domain-containing protein [Saprospiraceae bacterium]